MNSFGDRLRKLRKQKKMGQTDLGARLGLSGAEISAYETGSRNPPIDALIGIARIFNVSIDYLVGNERKNEIDLSGLTEQEVTALINLIVAMKNK